jgi:hypothetical protein
MSVIAWDGITLAADKQSTIDGVRHTTTKIRETVDGRLIGAVGDSGMCRTFLDWLEAPEDVRDPMDEPIIPENSIDAVEIRPDGTVWRWEQHGHYMIEDQHFATGSGKDFAMAAMYLGHTAHDAVVVANDLSHTCGCGVDTIELKQDFSLDELLSGEPMTAQDFQDEKNARMRAQLDALRFVTHPPVTEDGRAVSVNHTHELWRPLGTAAEEREALYAAAEQEMLGHNGWGSLGEEVVLDNSHEKSLPYPVTQEALQKRNDNVTVKLASTEVFPDPVQGYQHYSNDLHPFKDDPLGQKLGGLKGLGP